MKFTNLSWILTGTGIFAGGVWRLFQYPDGTPESEMSGAGFVVLVGIAITLVGVFRHGSEH